MIASAGILPRIYCFAASLLCSASLLAASDVLEPPIAIRSEAAEAVRVSFLRESASEVIADIPTVKVGGTWTAIGPAPTRSGQVTVPPNNEIAGAIQAIAPHPTDANTLYIGAVGGGVWKTTNATAASPVWIPLTDTQASLSIGAVEFDISDPTLQTVVAGSARLSSFGAVGGSRIGILRTTNGGATWSVLGSTTLASENITSVAARGSVILAGSDSTWGGGNGSGLFRSSDTGASFVRISAGAGTGLPSGSVSDIVADPNVPTRFYAAIKTVGIFVSNNTGATWTNVTTGITGISSATDKIEMAVHNNGTTNAVYVAVINNGALASVWRSTTLGTSWTQMDTPAASPGAQGDIHFSICADRNNANFVYIGGDRIGSSPFTGNLFRGNAAAAAGSQFTTIMGANGGNTTPHADSRELVMDANGNLIEGDDGGLYRRLSPQTNTGTWTSVIGNLACFEAHDVAYDAISRIAMVGTQDNGTHIQSATGSSIWTFIAGGDGGDVAVDDFSSTTQSIRYGSSQNLGGFFRRTYNAANVSVGSVSPALTLLNGSAAIGLQFTTPIALNKVNPARLIIGGSNSPYESLNRGDSVTAISAGFGVNGTFSGKPLVYGGFLAGVANPDVLYYGSGSSVRVRTTAGSAVAATTAAFPGGTVQDIILDSDDWRRAFVCDSSRVYVTANSGGSWTDITGNLTGVGTLRTLEFFQLGARNCVAVGANFGVYCSFVGSFGTWFQLGDNLPNTVVYDMEYNRLAHVLVAGTMGRSAFLLNINTSPVVTLPGAAINYLENAPPVLLDPAATVTDSTSANFNGGSLTIDFLANGAAEDRLAISSQGTGAGQIGASGSSITFGAVEIATFAGGSDGFTPLVVTFNSNVATPAAVQALVRRISYENISEDPQTLPRTLRVVVNDGDGDSSTAVTKLVNVEAVNDAPTVDAIANPTAILEDAVEQTISLTGISAGTGEVQVLTVTALSSNPDVIPNPTVEYNSPGATALLRYTPLPDANGTAEITVQVQDSGGIANGGVDSITSTFTVTITAVNDPPVFAIGPDPVVPEDAGPQIVGAFVLPLAAGPPNESAQTLTLIVSNDNPLLFAVAPTIAPDGTLGYTPAANAFGTATVTILGIDDGGRADGGSDSRSQSFIITVLSVNDAPSFTAGGDIVADVDGMPVSIPWATNITAGPSDEAGQALTFLVQAIDPTFFAAQPAIDPTTGVLSFTAIPGLTGSTSVTVQLQDDGGIANGGSDLSPPVSFTVTAVEINDPPSFTKGPDLVTGRDEGPQIIADWLRCPSGSTQ
jgi:hypothetical protein